MWILLTWTSLLSNKQIFNEYLKCAQYDSRTFFLGDLIEQSPKCLLWFVSYKTDMSTIDTSKCRKEGHKSHIFIVNFLLPIYLSLCSFPRNYFPSEVSKLQIIQN